MLLLLPCNAKARNAKAGSFGLVAVYCDFLKAKITKYH